MKIKRSIIKQIIKEEETSYQKFFKSVLKKFNVDSPNKLSDDKKKEFFNYIEKNWTKEKTDEQIQEEKIRNIIRNIINEEKENLKEAKPAYWNYDIRKVVDVGMITELEDMFHKAKNIAEFIKTFMKEYKDGEYESFNLTAKNILVPFLKHKKVNIQQNDKIDKFINMYL